MEQVIATILEKVLTESSLVAVILGFMWWLERFERQRIIKELSEKISKLTLALEIMKNQRPLVLDNSPPHDSG